MASREGITPPGPFRSILEDFRPLQATGRRMTDAGILGTNIVSQFDNLICWLLPDKKKDSVRKSGKYIIMMTDRPWHRWQGDGSSVKEGESHHIMMCKQISKLFEPLTIKA